MRAACRQQLVQQLRAALPPSSTFNEADSGDVAARPVEAGDEADPDRVAAEREDNRNRRGRGLGRERRGDATGVTMTATCRRTRSAANSGSRS